MEETKKCRRCGETIKKEAIKCKHCKSDIRLWHIRHPFLTIILGFFAIVFFMAMYDGVQQASVITNGGEPVLELESMSVYTEYDWHYITGTVKNISNESIDNIASVGIFTDSNGDFVKSADAMIDYDPLLPDQSSPFKVMASYNPAVAQGTVEFKILGGGTLYTKDGRL